MFLRSETYRAALIWGILALLLMRLIVGPTNIWFLSISLAILGGVFGAGHGTFSAVEMFWRGKGSQGRLSSWPYNWLFVLALLAVPLVVGIPFVVGLIPRILSFLLVLVLWVVVFWLWSRTERKALEEPASKQVAISPADEEDEPLWSRIGRQLDAAFESTATGLGVTIIAIFLAVRAGALPERWIYVAYAVGLVALPFLFRSSGSRKQERALAERYEKLRLPPAAPIPRWWVFMGLAVAGILTFAAKTNPWLAVAAFALFVTVPGVYVILSGLAYERIEAQVEKAEVAAAEAERKKQCDQLLTRYAKVFLPVRRGKLQKLVAEGMAPDELEELILALLDEPEAGVALGEEMPSRYEPMATVPESVFLDAETRFRHTYVLGRTGSGKTNFLLTLILQDLRAGRGLAAISPDTDLLTGILGQLPPERAGDVIYFDPSDEDRPICFNPLELSPGEDIDFRVDENVAAFTRVFGAPGQRMEEILSHTFYALLERPGSTLLDVEPLLEPKDSRLRREIAATTKDPQTARFFSEVYPRLPKGAHLPVVARINRLVRPRVLRTILCSPTTIDFGAVMDQGKIALFNLSEALGEGVSSLLGQLVISKFQMALLARSQVSTKARSPFLLYVDEFQTFAGAAIETYQKLLSRARKYQLGLVLAHQHTGQLPLELLKDILGNVATKVCFAMGFDDAARLAKELRVDPKQLVNLPIGSAYCKVADKVYQMQVPVVRPPRDAQQRSREVLERARAAQPVSEPRPARSAEPQAVPARPIRVTPKAAMPQTRDQAEPRTNAAERAPAEPVSAPAPPPVQGRGRKEHTYLQELIRRWAQSKNYLTEIEKQILDGLGSVDVTLQKDGLSIACEISIGSSPEQELGNVRKCLAGGFDAVAVVSTDKRHLTRVRDFAAEHLSESELARVQYLTPEDLFAFLEELEAEAPAQAQTETVRGYKVSRRVSRLSPTEKDARKKAISKVIVAATKRMRDKSA